MRARVCVAVPDVEGNDRRFLPVRTREQRVLVLMVVRLGCVVKGHGNIWISVLWCCERNYCAWLSSQGVGYALESVWWCLRWRVMFIWCWCTLIWCIVLHMAFGTGCLVFSRIYMVSDPLWDVQWCLYGVWSSVRFVLLFSIYPTWLLGKLYTRQRNITQNMAKREKNSMSFSGFRVEWHAVFFQPSRFLWEKEKTTKEKWKQERKKR